MSQTVILTFNDAPSYERYKNEVINGGGTIKKDFGLIALGFSAVLPQALLLTIQTFEQSGSLASNGIASFEPDQKVQIQPVGTAIVEQVPSGV